MPVSDTCRTEWISTQVTPEVYAAIERAAELRGQSVAEFVAAAAQELACRAIAEARVIYLSVEDQRRIADGVLGPPPPNGALRRAAAAHRRLLG